MKAENKNIPQVTENTQPGNENFSLASLSLASSDATENLFLKASDSYIRSIELPEIGYKSEILLLDSSENVSTTINKTDLLVHPQSADHSVNSSFQPLTTNQAARLSIESDAQTAQSLQSMNTDVTHLSSSTTAKSLIDVMSPNQPGATNTTVSKSITIKSGDTLSGIFKRLSLNLKTLHSLMRSSSDAKRLTRIKPGQEISFILDKDNQLLSISYPINKIDTLLINRKNDTFITQIDSKQVEVQEKFATGTITASLFAAGNQAGLSDSMIMKLAQLFGWDIDFALDIRKGDAFSLVYEEKLINGKKIAEGDILAAEFINQGKTFYAVRYTDASGRTDYYSEKGYSMRKAFLRTPVEFSRISSRFSSGRKHPVLNRIRAHKGVDYAASKGTPVKAAGKGKVIFKGKKGGYGRVVILQHGSKYTTLYAHLNSYHKKIKNGSRVNQGQIIGYVGSSGLATGPHLHYEFRVNGVHRNPLTVPLPSADPLAEKYRSDFKIMAENMISEIKSQKQSSIALNSE